MILQTERLILRPWCDADAENLYEYAKDDRVGPIAGWSPHTSVENSREVIRDVLSAEETYAVCLKEDNKAIGSIGLMIGKQSNLDLPENEGEIGYWIGVPFWGRGLIPEAMRELIRRAFDDLYLQTLWCGYFDGNEKSKRCQEKCGFVYHHTNKDVPWKPMGDIRTERITRLTREEWANGFLPRNLGENENSDVPPMLMTERLRIYPASNEQMERLIAAEPSPELKAAYGQMLDGCLSHLDKREWYAVWNVEYSGEVIGNLSFKGLEADGILEIGYGMHPEYEGRGFMTEAVSVTVRWAATRSGVKRIEAETEDGNAASKRVLEKAGFLPNGKIGEEGPRYVWRGETE